MSALLQKGFQDKLHCINSDITGTAFLIETVYFPFADMIVIISSIVAVSLASNLSTSPIR